MSLGPRPPWIVGSKTGAVLRRFGLAGAPRFLWECLNIRTVSQFPLSATSNPSCRFPAIDVLQHILQSIFSSAARLSVGAVGGKKCWEAAPVS
jgi:hypothetical protein